MQQLNIVNYQQQEIHRELEPAFIFPEIRIKGKKKYSPDKDKKNKWNCMCLPHVLEWKDHDHDSDRVFNLVSVRTRNWIRVMA